MKKTEIILNGITFVVPPAPEHLSGGDDCELTVGDWSTVTGGRRCRLKGGIGSSVSGGGNSHLTGGNFSFVGGGAGSIVQGGMGSLLALVYNGNGQFRPVVARVGLDGIKADTPYRLDRDGNFTEAPEHLSGGDDCEELDELTRKHYEAETDDGD